MVKKNTRALEKKKMLLVVAFRQRDTIKKAEMHATYGHLYEYRKRKKTSFFFFHKSCFPVEAILA